MVKRQLKETNNCYPKLGNVMQTGNGFLSTEFGIWIQLHQNNSFSFFLAVKMKRNRRVNESSPQIYLWEEKK